MSQGLRSRSPASIAAAFLTLGWSETDRGRFLLRRMLSSGLRRALRARSRPFTDPLPEAVLVMAPHPDDETLGCGGTLARLAASGCRVSVAFVTDGRSSHPGHSRHGPEAIAALRRREAEQALATLGIEGGGAHYLSGRDGGLSSMEATERERLSGEMRALVLRVRPDVVMLPCRGDGSDEHEASFALLARALEGVESPPRILEFPVWAWRNPLHLLRPLAGSRIVWRSDLAPWIRLKARALAAYASQTEPLPPQAAAVLTREFLAEFAREEEYFFEW